VDINSHEFSVHLQRKLPGDKNIFGFRKLFLALASASGKFLSLQDCSGGNNSPSHHSVAAGCIFFRIYYFSASCPILLKPVRDSI